MRYVPINCVRSGMFLGKTLYSQKGQILLKEGSIIKEVYIEKIYNLGYNGIYIQDELSLDIEAKGVISEDLKVKVVKKIKDTFIEAEKFSKLSEKSMDDMKSLVSDMINEITDNSNLMINLVDLKQFDDYTYFHSVNVAVLSIVMGVALKISKEELYELGLGALLHDIGKVFIDKEILNKPGKLTDEEFEKIKEHPMLGYEYIKKNFDVPLKAYVAICHHHEKYDGTGYPSKRKGKDIFVYGRVISIADVYDALTSDRSYRKAMIPSEAMEYIMGNSGIMFDPELVALFMRKVAPFPTGTCVKLSNGQAGIVVNNYEDSCMRPKIRIIDEKNKINTDEYVDLRYDVSAYNVTIVEILEF